MQVPHNNVLRWHSVDHRRSSTYIVFVSSPTEMFKTMWGYVLLALSLGTVPLESARILGLFPHPGESHFVFFEPILRALDSAGHEVHNVAHFEMKNVSSRFQNIIVSNPGSSKNAVDLSVSKRSTAHEQDNKSTSLSVIRQSSLLQPLPRVLYVARLGSGKLRNYSAHPSSSGDGQKARTILRCHSDGTV